MSKGILEHTVSASRGSSTAATMVVNLSAIRDNFQRLRQLSQHAECAAVVKGDGYGHGMMESAKTLRESGAETFFVATAEDAVALRDVVGDATVAVLCGYVPAMREAYNGWNLVPVLNSLEQIRYWSEQSQVSGGRRRAILHVDTGMNRLGLREGQLATLLEDGHFSSGMDIIAVMTHFSAADDLDFERCDLQRRRFLDACSSLPGVRRSMANSAASYFGDDFCADMYRPGKSTFGINPLTGQPNPLTEPASVHAPLLQVETIQRGTPVGYASTFRPIGSSRIATVGIGYVNGYPRSASNNAVMAVNGIRVPVVGRVSMDVTMIDVSAVPERFLQLGGHVEVLGPTVSAQELAQKCGTIEHEILIGLGRGCRRVHVEYALGKDSHGGTDLHVQAGAR